MGLTLEDAGMARPSLGVRVPLADLAPGMAGRRRGTGEDDIVMTGFEAAIGTGASVGAGACDCQVRT